MNSNQPKHFFKEAVFVFLFSLVLVNLTWHFLPESLKVNENSDYLSVYKPVARNLLAGKGLTLEDGSIAISYPPGYSLFLASAMMTARFASVSEERMIMQFHFISTAMAAALLFLIAARIWNARAAFFVPAAWLFYPYTIWYFKQPNSEIPFLAFFYGVLLCLVSIIQTKNRSPRAYFLLGGFAGLAMLVRPIAIGLGCLFAAILFFANKGLSLRLRIFLAGILLIGNLAAILPWQAWAYSKTGKVILLADNGVYSMRDGITFAVNTKGYRQLAAVPEDVKALMRRAFKRADDMTSFGDIALFLSEEFKQNPQTVIKLIGIKAVRCWYGTDSGRNERAAAAVQVVSLTFLLFAFSKAFAKGPRFIFTAFGAVILYFWVMALQVLPVFRYLFPVCGIFFTALPVLFVTRDECARTP